MDVIIRAMEREDWDAVAAIFQEGIDLKTSTFHQEVPSYEDWDASHTADCRLVAVAEGRVIGWTALTPYSRRKVYSGVAELGIYIKAEYRGRKVGEKLLKALIEESEKQGYWTLQAGIFEINKASIALHEKVGFRMVGYRERIGRDGNGVWQNTVLMERRSPRIGI
jgi:phosphinothricin acetyltransferase